MAKSDFGGKEMRFEAQLLPREREVLLAGGKLKYLREGGQRISVVEGKASQPSRERRSLANGRRAARMVRFATIVMGNERVTERSQIGRSDAAKRWSGAAARHAGGE